MRRSRRAWLGTTRRTGPNEFGSSGGSWPLPSNSAHGLKLPGPGGFSPRRRQVVTPGGIVAPPGGHDVDSATSANPAAPIRLDQTRPDRTRSDHLLARSHRLEVHTPETTACSLAGEIETSVLLSSAASLAYSSTVRREGRKINREKTHPTQIGSDDAAPPTETAEFSERILRVTPFRSDAVMR